MRPGLRARCAAVRPLVPEFLNSREAIMAGKLQLAAKCLLGTTLLASGTAGVYYATTYGWSLPGAGQTTKQPAAELDAVAGAWAEPATKPASPVADSSAVARSAVATRAHTDKPVAKPSDADRYATPAPAPAPATVANAD